MPSERRRIAKSRPPSASSAMLTSFRSMALRPSPRRPTSRALAGRRRETRRRAWALGEQVAAPAARSCSEGLQILNGGTAIALTNRRLHSIRDENLAEFWTNRKPQIQLLLQIFITVPSSSRAGRCSCSGSGSAGWPQTCRVTWILILRLRRSLGESRASHRSSCGGCRRRAPWQSHTCWQTKNKPRSREESGKNFSADDLVDARFLILF